MGLDMTNFFEVIDAGRFLRISYAAREIRANANGAKVRGANRRNAETVAHVCLLSAA